MQDNDGKNDAPEPADERAANAFAPREMLACPTCSRMNPPTRTGCLYCGAAIDAPEEVRSKYWPVVRSADAWESGFNVIVIYTGEASVGSSGEIASGLGIDADAVSEIFESGEPMPLARVPALSEAEALTARLEAVGIPCRIVSDEALRPREPQIRLKAIEFTGDGVLPLSFAGGEPTVPFSPSVMVEGFIVRKQIEASEGRKRRAGKITDAVETGSDQRVIDLYAPGHAVGFRIRTDGFDFSVLGERKAFTAAENIRILSEELRDRFPGAAQYDAYKSLRRALGICWPMTEGVSSEGFERKSFGGYSTRRAHSTSNEDQFLRYSRLKQYLRENE